MKKTFLFALVAVLAMGALLVGCTGQVQTNSPTWVTTQFLNAVKANDAATMAKYYDGEPDENEFDLENMIGEGADFSPAMRNTLTNLSKKILDFDFKVTNEKIDGDKATVDVEVKTYNFGKFLTDVMGDYVGTAFSMALSGGQGVTAEQFEAELVKVMDEKLGNLKDKSFTTTVPISLKKTADGWKVQELDDNFVNAVMGGLMSTLSDIFGNLGALGGSGSSGSFDLFGLFGSGDASSPFDLFGSGDGNGSGFNLPGLSDLLSA